MHICICVGRKCRWQMQHAHQAMQVSHSELQRQQSPYSMRCIQPETWWR